MEYEKDLDKTSRHEIGALLNLAILLGHPILKSVQNTNTVVVSTSLK